MLKDKIKLLLTIVMVIFIALSPLSFADDENQITEDKVTDNVEAQPEDTVDTPNESEDDMEDIKQGDEYIIGDSVNIDYIIDGNLYVIANDVTISSQVVGNVFICANKVTTTNQSNISNSLYAIANDIEINGVVYDLYTSSKNITISGYIYRDIHTISDNFSLYGVVSRHAYVSSKNFNFQKTEKIENQNESIFYSGQVSGDFNYSSDEQIEVPAGVISGKLTFYNFKYMPSSPNYFVKAITFIFLVIAVWALCTWLAPRFYSKTTDLLTKKPLKTIGCGLLGLIVFPIISILLIMSQITISIGLFLLSAYLILCGISTAIFIISINNVIAKKLKLEKTLRTFLLLIITSLVAWAITLIPFVGPIFYLIYLIVGIGIIMKNLICKKDKIEDKE